MKDKKNSDAFTYHILNRIDKKTLESLSPAQISAIKDAISAKQPQKRHPIDFRGIINLFFIKYYFVFFVGRDRRISTQETELGRREDVALLGNVFFIIFVISPFILLGLIALYFLKIGAGIDLFPGEHMGWILGL